MLSKLQAKIELLNQYINEIIVVIKAYSHSDRIKSTKDLKYIAEELATIIIEGRSNVTYLADVEDTSNYVALQTPVVSNGETTSFYLGSNSRTTIYDSKSGTTVYNYILAKNHTITNYAVDSIEKNDEGWKHFNIIVRANSTFTSFHIRNSNIIALRASLNVDTADLTEFCMNNKQLRTVHMSTNATTMTRAFADCSNLMCCEFTNNPQFQYCDEMFLNCSSLLSVKLDLSKCTNATDIFKNCTNLQTIELENGIINDVITELDLSYCTKMTLNNTVAFLNSLQVNEGNMKIIYIAHNLSSAQKTAFRNRGYNPIYKVNE